MICGTATREGFPSRALKIGRNYREEKVGGKTFQGKLSLGKVVGT